MAEVRVDEARADGVMEERTRASHWSGVDVSYSEVRCDGRLAFRCVGTKGVRLTMVLEQTGGHLEPRRRLDLPCPSGPVPRLLSMVPADEPLWGYSSRLSSFKKLTLLFELDELRERLSDDILHEESFEPRLSFEDKGSWQLGWLLAEECASAQPLGPLYADSLLVALFARLTRAKETQNRCKRGGLTRRQLERVCELMESQLAQPVSLRALAELTGFSHSHFCHAFKVSTGLPPHRWLLEARVGRARQLLLERRLSLPQVALATGFADQSHFTRVFKRLTGATPAAWQRDRES